MEKSVAETVNFNTSTQLQSMGKANSSKSVNYTLKIRILPLLG